LHAGFVRERRENEAGSGRGRIRPAAGRATLKAWLVEQAIDASGLTSKGFGDTKPIDTNSTAEGRADNRRVEFARIEP